MARFFPNAQAASPNSKMAEPESSLHQASEPYVHVVSLAAFMAPEAYLDTSAVLCSGSQSPSSNPLTLHLDAELITILQALTTMLNIVSH